MTDYQLTATEAVIRTVDNVSIPNDPDNYDWIAYQKWVDEGNTPDPYVEPKPDLESLEPTPEQTLAFEHENRILALEGKPPLSIKDFVKKVKAK